jgi:hypothetical protein
LVTLTGFAGRQIFMHRSFRMGEFVKPIASPLARPDVVATRCIVVKLKLLIQPIDEIL